MVALCMLAVLGCILFTHPRYDIVRVNWANIRSISKHEPLQQPLLRDNTMTLVYVMCEDDFNLGIVAVKSAVAYSSTRLRLIIIADKLNEKKMRKEYSSWPENVRKRVSCDVVPLWFPKENGLNWQLLFRPCSTQRLFLPNTLPDVDAVLYADTDVIFLHPIEDIRRMFYAMNEYQMAGMAPETENLENNYYIKRKVFHPYVQPLVQARSISRG